MNLKKETCYFLQAPPNFYQNIILMFNTCKLTKPIDNLNSVELLSQIIWGNEYFKTSNKCLYFKGWVNSNILYFKYLFDTNGQWIWEPEIMKKVINKSNWIVEYTHFEESYRETNKKTCQYIQLTSLKCTNFMPLISIEG